MSILSNATEAHRDAWRYDPTVPLLYDDPETRPDRLYTATGVRREPFLPDPGDEVIEVAPCVWCGGAGYGGDAVGYSDDCDACNGTGKGHTTRVGAMRREAYDDLIFNVDASRAEIIDHDCCPDCGYGGGHEDPQDCPRHREAEAYVIRSMEAPFQPIYLDDDREPEVNDEPPPDVGTHAGAVIREYDDLPF